MADFSVEPVSKLVFVCETYRHFEQRQEFFTWMVSDLARPMVRRRGGGCGVAAGERSKGGVVKDVNPGDDQCSGASGARASVNPETGEPNKVPRIE